MRKCLVLGLFVFYISLISCDKSKNYDFDLILSNANVVDVTNGKVLPDQMIGILDGNVALVDESVRALVFSAPQEIDLQGSFIMPGLWDNHVHFRGGDSLIAENKALLDMFIEFGVTTIRDGGGDITKAVLQWKSQIDRGTVVGPTIFTPGPKLDGNRPAWEGSLKVTDMESAKTALDSLEALGASFVKLYDGSLTEEAFFLILDEAEKRNLKVTGHMPLRANVLEAAERGLDGNEHLYYVLKASAPEADSLLKILPGYAMFYPIAQRYDESVARSLYTQLAKSDFYVTPTLYIGKVLDTVLDVDHKADSLLARIGPRIQKTYEGRVKSAQRRRDSGADSRESVETVFRKMIMPMNEAGINLLAGSDCGPFNSFVYPGESLWMELEMMVEAGLNPQEALKTSVLNGPKWFDLLDKYGSIESGKVADLIVLKENPLEDISNIQTLQIVVKRGTVVHQK